MKFFKCQNCGNMIEMIIDKGTSVVCCGENMKEVIPGTSDGAVEKHLPVTTVTGNKVCVVVGAVDHPMLDVHYIQWIAIETNKGTQRKYLNPSEASKAEFLLADGEELVATYAYCNLHGLWKA